VDHPCDRQAIHPRRPLIGLDLPPGLPEDVRSPDLVLETIKSSLLVLLGGAIEGSLQFPDCVCSVGSRRALGHPTLLRAPVTEAGLLSSHPVSRAIHTVLGAPRTSCWADSDFGAAFYAVVPRGHLGPSKISRPATCNSRRVPPLTPRHLQRGSSVHSSPRPVSLPAQTIRSAGAGPYHEATLGSLVLQPAALHLSFKGTSA
jgi:hypothetical protein